MTGPGVGTIVLYHTNPAHPYDLVGFVCCTPDSWNSDWSQAQGQTEPAPTPGTVHLIVLNADGSSPGLAANVAPGTGNGQYSLIPQSVGVVLQSTSEA